VYDPATGRFTQEDPIGLAGGLNLYGFANSNPLSYSDPFGLCPTCRIIQIAERLEQKAPAIEAEGLRLGQVAASYGPRFTSFYSNLAQTIGARLNNLVGHVTEREHLSFTSLENQGKSSALKATGEAFDHVRETVETMNGVRNLLPRIQSALADSRAKGQLREQFQQLMSRASKSLDAMERALRQ
jgi:uncharacterized protein RhaS with RHS repeats